MTAYSIISTNSESIFVPSVCRDVLGKCRRYSCQDEILEMKNKLGEVYTVLVCNDDGIVCLSFDELKMVLNAQHEEIEWISASRGSREKYEVKGSDGKLKCKIGNSEFPNKVLKMQKTKPGIFSWLK